MNLKPFTFNGATIDDGVNYNATLMTEGQLSPSSEIIEVSRTNNFPVYAGKEFQSKILPLMVEFVTGGTADRDWLNTVLDSTDTTERTFVCKDTDDSNKQWYVSAVVKKHTDMGPSHAEYILYAADPVWKSVNPGTITTTLTASPGTIMGTVGGGFAAYPTIYITPGSAKTGSYAYKRFIEIYNPSSSITYVNYPVNIVDNGSGTGTWNSSALVAGGTITSAAGNDVRFMMDNSERDRWFGNFNTGTTTVWSNVSLKPKVELILASALGTTSVSELEFKHNNKDYRSITRTALRKLPSAGLLKTPANEYIYYADVEPDNFKVTNISRAVRGSTVGTVAAGGTLLFIEHDAWLMYNNSAAVAPTQDDEQEPAISLTASSNISHKWETFGELAGNRSLQWFPSLLSTRGGQSYTYSGNHGTQNTDPFTEMGMACIGYAVGSRAQAESANMAWDLYHPAGGTQVIYSGETYSATNSYPKYRRLQKSNSGEKYTDVSNIATPAPGTWTNFSGTVALGGTYNRFRWNLYGGLTAVTDNAAYFEVNDFTLPLQSANVPVVTMRDQQNNYRIDMTIENVTTGESIDIDWTTGLGKYLFIDCQNNQAYDNDDLTPANSAITPNSQRDYWLKLLPGVNEIVITEEGLTDVSVEIYWEEKIL